MNAMLPINEQIAYAWSSARRVKGQHSTEHIHIARYIRPELAEFFEERRPTDRPAIELLWDDTAPKANDAFARGLWSMAHNQVSEWFSYEDKNPRVMNDAEAAAWYNLVNEDLRTELISSGAYVALLLRLSDVGAFGFGALYSYTENGQLRFEWVPASECFYTLGRDGLCNSFIRPLNLTARQAIDERKWSTEKLDQTVLTAYANKDESSKFLFLHVVWERKTAYRGRARSNLDYPWAGWYYQVQNRTVLDEHGFHEMPYHVLNWGAQPGIPYPVGIGYRTLPEVRNLNADRRTYDRLKNLEADSPVLAPDGAGQPGNDQWRPQTGEMIYGGMSGDGKRLYEPYYTGNGQRSFREDNEVSRQIIRQAWFNDLFLMQTQRQMTAEEVRSRDAKLIQAMGPFAILFASDAKTLVERAFFTRLRAGAYDPMPAVFDANTKMKLKFSGLLAKAQQVLEGEQIVGLFAEAGLIAQSWAQIAPDTVQEIADTLDPAAAIRHLGNSKSIPKDIVRSPEAAREHAEKRAAQQQQMAAAQMAPELARAAKDGAAALKDVTSIEANDNMAA